MSDQAYLAQVYILYVLPRGDGLRLQQIGQSLRITLTPI